MEHPYLFGLTVFCLVLILLWKFLSRKHIDVDTYEYMEVLNFHDWKTTRQIRKQMMKNKGGWISIAEVFVALDELEKERHVESRARNPKGPEAQARGCNRVKEYRLTSSPNF